ncbi:MAG: type II toxin-antitoxin system RelE/ParE family toxin [Alphaproteobacteria bacterium]|nr:type II toxin-antitoxin system RelE/ParE family toxin [Alphaproteobacteria bacterium]
MEKAPVTIVETNAYLRRAERLLTEEERTACSELIARDPACGEIMQGTGGVRKLRIALDGRGKRGGGRVVYYFHNESIPVFLLDVFAKNEKSNLTKAERNAMAELTRVLARYGEKR